MTFDPNDPALQAYIEQAVAAALQALNIPSQAHGTIAREPVASNSVRATSLPPALGDITLAQFTLLNNGKLGERKKYETEFKVCAELWTAPMHQIRLSEPQWKRNVSLIAANVFPRRIKKLVAGGSITQAYHDALYEIWREADTLTGWFGLIGDKGSLDGSDKKGTNYYPHRFLYVTMEHGKPTDMIVGLDGDVLHVERFVTTTSRGNALTGKYTHQARVDRSDYDAEWRTQ